jgi:hypothetical protein
MKEREPRAKPHPLVDTEIAPEDGSLRGHLLG